MSSPTVEPLDGGEDKSTTLTKRELREVNRRRRKEKRKEENGKKRSSHPRKAACTGRRANGTH